MTKIQGKKSGLLGVFRIWGICTGILLLISVFIPITYGINDDVTMRDIASGAMSGSPNGHLIFVKFALGSLIAGFYKIFPGVDWYGCIWLGLFCLCISLLLYRWRYYYVHKKQNFSSFATAFFAMFFILGLEHVVHFQFTIVAAVVAGTAVFFYNTIDEKKDGKRQAGEYVFVLLLMWTAYCIRSRVFWMAVPFAGLTFLFKKDSWKRKCGLLVISLAGIAAISGIERLAYSGQEWKDYLEYNQYRANVYDHYGFPSYEENAEFYRSIGMKGHDIDNLSRYSLFLIDGIETGKMRQISDYAKLQQEKNITWLRKVKDGIKCAAKGFFEPENLYLNLFANGILCYNLFYELKKRRKEFFLNLGFLVIEGVIWFYLGYQGRLPARVGGTLLLLVLLSAWSVFYQEHQEEMVSEWKSSWVKRILFVFLMGIAFINLTVVRKKQTNCFAENKEREQLEQYFRSHKANVYFVPTYILSDYIENFRVFKTFRVSNGFSLGGWSAFMPLKMAGLEHYGILNVERAIIEKDNIYMILPNVSTKIGQHYEKNYGAVDWKECDRISISGRELFVFQIIVQEDV